MPCTRLARHCGPPPVHAGAHDGPTAGSSTTRADSRAPWPCRTPTTPARPWPRRDRRLLARSRSIIERRQRPICHRPFDAALHRLVMNAKSLPDRKERQLLTIGEQHRCPRYPARWLGSRPRKSRQRLNLLNRHRQLNRLPPCCHDTAPRSINHKRGIHQQIFRSMIGSMELVVLVWFGDSRLRTLVAFCELTIRDGNPWPLLVLHERYL